jgi:transcription elongation GreA/GreB family factor
MANSNGSLTELAKRADYKTLEDRWLAAIEQAAQHRDDMLSTLEFLTKNTKGPLAVELGWSWLTTEKERSKPTEVLALGRELMIRCGESPEMRKELVSLYQDIYKDRPEIERLLEASGLSGDKSPRRALRTLEICLNLKAGDFLLGRSDEKAAEVVTIDAEVPEYTIRVKSVEHTLDPDTLGLKFDLVAANDFRALSQLHPERIADLLDADPVALVTGLLHSHHGQLDSDELKHVLSPKYIPAAKWASWWSKARAALNRSRNVVLEGRNPVVIVYHHAEQTLEDEIEPQWAEADTPTKRLAVVETYLREAKARGTKPASDMIARMYADLIIRVKAARKGAPAEALVEALVIDRIAQDGLLSDQQPNPVREILQENPDVGALLAPIEESRFYLRTLDRVREEYPDRWMDIFVDLLPHAPLDGCEAIAEALTEAGQAERLKPVAELILSDFTQHLDAVCWLWRGKIGATVLPIPPREMLSRLLEHLAQITRNDYVAPKTLRDTRTHIRAALSAANYSRFREVIEGMEAGLASTIRTTVDRQDALGHVVRGNLIKIIHERHPELNAPRTRQVVDPWQDDSVIYCTQQGFDKRKEEVDYLTRVKIPENARAIGEAAARGDLSENSEYKFALEERDLLQARVMKMQQELSLARLVTPGEVNTGEVNIGTRLALVSTNGAHRRDFTILGPFEADIEKAVYNYRAPLCGKLRGLHVGDTVKLELGEGEQEYRLESITNAVTK